MDTVKAEKANAMKRYRRGQKVGIFFRFLEICILLFFISWFTVRLPIAVKISGDYFRHLSVLLVSPLFVFLVGNAIVITLFLKSSPNSTGNSSSADLYDEFLRNREIRQKTRAEEPPQGVVYEDKTVIYSKNTDTDAETKTFYRRSRSENVSREKKTEFGRSVTEVGRKVEKYGEKAAYISTEEMSDEEFQRKVEAFIEKNLRLRRQESMAVVLRSQG